MPAELTNLNNRLFQEHWQKTDHLECDAQERTHELLIATYRYALGRIAGEREPYRVMKLDGVPETPLVPLEGTVAERQPLDPATDPQGRGVVDKGTNGCFGCMVQDLMDGNTQKFSETSGISIEHLGRIVKGSIVPTPATLNRILSAAYVADETPVRAAWHQAYREKHGHEYAGRERFIEPSPQRNGTH